MNATTAREREFAFTDADFEHIRELVRQHSGINLTPAKKDMVYSRLARRLRQLNLNAFREYLDRLAGDDEELIHFTNAITTNLTAFFRENHHFTHLAETLLPRLVAEKGRERRLRIWSAGCSTGEEPYSIAMVVGETVPEGWDVKILATDLDSNVLETAARGVYAEERVSNIQPARLHRWFLRGKGGNAGTVRVRRELQGMIHFRQLNLLKPWPFKGPLDLIFCRNVVIYFDKETQRALFDRFASVLSTEGHLFVGHSESLYQVTDRFRLLGNTIYRRTR